MRQGGEEKRAALQRWQQRLRRVDAVGDSRPEVWSGLGSSVEPHGSKEETQTNKLQSKYFYLKTRNIQVDNILVATWPKEI